MNNRNFLEAYMTYCSGNEAPENYHLWAGLSALSSVISRRVWLSQGIFNVYSNLYVVLVGTPGNGKTTSMSIAKRLVRMMKVIPFSAECQTKESLVKEMAACEQSFEYQNKAHAYTPMSVFVTELSQFLGVESSHMIDFLTTVYDQDFYDRKTANKGNQLIVGPYLTILACATPKCIATYLKGDVISGGFSRRAIFVFEGEVTERVPFPEVTETQTQAWQDLIDISQNRLLLTKGAFEWDPEAKEWFADWYTNYKLPDDELLRFYHRTKHVQLLKVALLFAVAESSELKLKKEHLMLALAALEKTEKNLSKVFYGIGRNQLNQISGRILELLEQNEGAIPEKRLLRLLWADASYEEIYAALRHLSETSGVQKIAMTQKGVTRTFLVTAEVYARLQPGRAPSAYPPGDLPSGSPSSD